MTDNAIACLMVWTGYFGVVFAMISVPCGTDFGFAFQMAVASVVFIWLGKRLDRSVAAFKAKTN
jgi:hypothetical protein